MAVCRRHHMLMTAASRECTPAARSPLQYMNSNRRASLAMYGLLLEVAQ